MRGRQEDKMLKCLNCHLADYLAGLLACAIGLERCVE